LIEENEFNGRPCVVVYLDGYLRPVDSQDEAELANVVFTNEKGGSMFFFNKYRNLGNVSSS
jgi:hypothetical protein